MNRKTLFVLIPLTLAAILYIVLVERHRLSPQERQRHETLVFPDLAARKKSVNRIEILHAGQRMVIERTENEENEKSEAWRIIAPFRYPADKGRVQGFLQRLERMEKAREKAKAKAPPVAKRGKKKDKDKDKDEASALAALGLAGDGRWRIRLFSDASADPLVLDLRIGDETFGGGGFYLTLDPDGERVDVATHRAFLDDLQRGPDWLRARNVVKRVAVSGVTLTTDKQTIELARRGETLWDITAPFADHADGQYLERSLQELLNTRAESFVSADLAKELALAVPRLRITVRSEDEPREQTLLVGAAVPDRPQTYTMRRDEPDAPVMIVRSPLIEQFSRDADSFRDPRLLSFDFKQVSRLTLERGERRIVLEKRKTRWHIGGTINAPADRAIVDDLLKALAREPVRDFRAVSQDRDALIQAGVTVRVEFTADARAPETVIIGLPQSGGNQADNDQAWAIRGQWLCSVSRLLAEDVARDNLHFRRRQLLALAVPDIQELALNRGEHMRWARRRDGNGNGSWEVLATFGLQPQWPEERLLNELVWRLAALAATRFIGDVPPARRKSFGLVDKPLRVSLKFRKSGQGTQGETESASAVTTAILITIGSRAESGGHYAELSTDEKMVFLLDDALVRLIEQALNPPADGSADGP